MSVELKTWPYGTRRKANVLSNTTKAQAVVDAEGEMQLPHAIWNESLMPWLKEQCCPKATGWWAQLALEVVP